MGGTLCFLNIIKKFILITEKPSFVILSVSEVSHNIEKMRFFGLRPRNDTVGIYFVFNLKY